MEEETWAPVTGLEGKYEVSNLGSIRSLFWHRNVRRKKPWMLKSSQLPNGYWRVHLPQGGRFRTCYVHRLVAAAFVANPLEYPNVNHLDGNKSNNKATNLEWCTQKQNLAHAVTTGLMSPQQGSGNHAAKLSDRDVREIRRRYIRGKVTLLQLGNEYGVSFSLIGGIVRGDRWSHM